MNKPGRNCGVLLLSKHSGKIVGAMGSISMVTVISFFSGLFAMIWFSRNNGILCIVSLRSTPSFLEPVDELCFNLYLACAGYLLEMDFRAVLVCLGSACASGVLHARLLGASRNSI